jgi:hypothetical protein
MKGLRKEKKKVVALKLVKIRIPVLIMKGLTVSFFFYIISHQVGQRKKLIQGDKHE